MTVDRQLVTEILDQLEDDILNFEWLVKIAQLQNRDRSELDCVSVILDSVMVLHCNGEIIVGDAIKESDMVLIQPWPEARQELRTRILSTIQTSDRGDRPFCFWIQLTKHFAK